MDYEYRVIPAPKRLKKVKGVSSPSDLLAATLTDAINAEAREGWEYLRAEAVGAEQPGGFLRRARWVEETVMIFRRPRRRESAREPSLRELHQRDTRNVERTVERGGPAAPRAQGPGPGNRPLSGLFTKGDAPAVDHQPRSGTGPGTPPLLRPVPRRGPGEKS